MKSPLILAALAAAFYASAACAEEDAAPAPDQAPSQAPSQAQGSDKYTIVNGKKFFSLSNARRRTHTDGRMPAIITPNSHETPAMQLPPRLQPAQPQGNNQPAEGDDILSIFAPPSPATK